MSSKKIWAASLAAVIAGSAFAVVASATGAEDKETADPGYTESGVEVGDATMDFSLSNTSQFDKEKTKLADDKKSFVILPNIDAYDDESTKIDITLTLKSDTFKGLNELNFDITGATFDSVKDDVLVVKIKEYDFKANAGQTTKVKVVATTTDKKTHDYEFAVDNQGQFKVGTVSYDVSGNDFVVKVDTEKKKDRVLVVYDGEAVGKDFNKNIKKVSVTAIGTGSVNNRDIELEQEISYPTGNEQGITTATLNYKGYATDDSQYTTLYKTDVKFQFVSEDKYNNIEADPEDESKPADESSNTSTEESKPTVSTSEVKVEVGEDGVLEGADLTKAVFVDTLANKTWNDVKTVTFKSEVPFSLGFAVKAGAVKDKADATWYQKGVDELAKEDLPESAFATEWTLTEEEVAAMIEGSETDTLKLTTKDGKAATITANVTVKETAPNTGIALAIAPAALATAFVTVAAVMSKKKKG